MKKLSFILLSVILLFALNSFAQSVEPGNKPSKQLPNGENSDIYKSNGRSDVIQTVGRTYNEKELERMPNTDINKIANMVPGVSSRAGETPSIKGASPSGTAYFVDGVRIYGALPMLMK